MLDQIIELMRELIHELQLLRMYAHLTPANDAHPNRPLTREEAADYLGVHKDTLYRWAVEEGRIAYSRLGDGSRAPIRFTQKDLDEFINVMRITSVRALNARRS